MEVGLSDFMRTSPLGLVVAPAAAGGTAWEVPPAFRGVTLTRLASSVNGAPIASV
jgi:hypothetical protein